MYRGGDYEPFLGTTQQRMYFSMQSVPLTLTRAWHENIPENPSVSHPAS